MTTMMKSGPTPSDREVLTGLVERVTYQNAENGFCIVRVKARGQHELVTLVGHAAAISAGEWITGTGNWVNDRTQQFKALFLKTSAPATVYLLWRGHCDNLTAFRSAARKSQSSGKTPAGLRTPLFEPSRGA